MGRKATLGGALNKVHDSKEKKQVPGHLKGSLLVVIRECQARRAPYKNCRSEGANGNGVGGASPPKKGPDRGIPPRLEDGHMRSPIPETGGGEEIKSIKSLGGSQKYTRVI